MCVMGVLFDFLKNCPYDWAETQTIASTGQYLSAGTKFKPLVCLGPWRRASWRQKYPFSGILSIFGLFLFFSQKLWDPVETPPSRSARYKAARMALSYVLPSYTWVEENIASKLASYGQIFELFAIFLRLCLDCLKNEAYRTTSPKLNVSSPDPQAHRQSLPMYFCSFSIVSNGARTFHPKCTWGKMYGGEMYWGEMYRSRFEPLGNCPRSSGTQGK